LRAEKTVVEERVHTRIHVLDSKTFHKTAGYETSQECVLHGLISFISLRDIRIFGLRSRTVHDNVSVQSNILFLQLNIPTERAI
jgi:hypothetical protein